MWWTPGHGPSGANVVGEDCHGWGSMWTLQGHPVANLAFFSLKLDPRGLTSSLRRTECATKWGTLGPGCCHPECQEENHLGWPRSAGWGMKWDKPGAQGTKCKEATTLDLVTVQGQSSQEPENESPLKACVDRKLTFRVKTWLLGP